MEEQISLSVKAYGVGAIFLILHQIIKIESEAKSMDGSQRFCHRDL